MDRKKKKVFVAMSGGVDSSVAAALLKEEGWDVCGVHIKMWSDPSIPCNFKEDIHDAARVAAVLDIPFRVWDITREYKKDVVDYMIKGFKSGRTPNPDVMCNRHVKFGVFLEKALAAGADFVATGHYVRLSDSLENTLVSVRRQKLVQDSAGYFFSEKNRAILPHHGFLQESPRFGFRLKVAKDLNKDQSYFLWTLTQKQLRHCLFPLGGYTKPEVRKLAQKFGLPTAEKKDSQGICFIGEIDLKEFLQKHIRPKPGKIVTTSGKVVGQHDGLAFYTIGQRHGLAIGGGIPYYVVGKDSKKNILLVGEGPYDEKLFSTSLTAGDLNWIAGKAPKMPLKCEARIRYRQPLQKCLLKKVGGKIKINFSVPQRAVTSGQSVVFYLPPARAGRAQMGEKWEMLGGGVIE